MPDSAPPRFTIVGQREDFGPRADGTFGMGVVVSFRTAAGHTGSVFVPTDEYTVERVAALVAAKVATMEAVAALGT